MNAKLAIALALVFAVGLVGCLPTQVDTGNVPASPTEAPTLVPTSVPTLAPTATLEPTPVPTEVPTEETTPTVTPEPTLWEIVKVMMAECGIPETAVSDEVSGRYFDELGNQVADAHPELDSPLWMSLASSWVSPEKDGNQNPFAFAEGMLPRDALLVCDGYVLYIENVPDNLDGDGTLVGKAHLFYEVGGTRPYVLDGELQEVRFTFQPVP